MMHRGSCECSTSALALFTLPATQTSIEDRQYIEHHPIATITEDGPIEFSIKGPDEDYLDLFDNTLEIKVKITKGAANLADDAKVGPTNLFLHTLFSQCDVYANGVAVSSVTNTYPYKTYLEKILNYSEDTLKSQFANCLYEKDESGKLDKNDPTAAAAADKNTGLVTRRKAIAASKEVILRGSLHTDLFACEKYMLNKVDIRVKLTRSRAAFCLIGDVNEYKVQILSAKLIVPQVKINPAILNEHSMQLMKTNAKYPLRRTMPKTFTIPTGNMSQVKENLYVGQQPRRVVIACVDAEAYAGNITKNPYNFQHFNLNSLSVFIDGQRYPTNPLRPDFANDQYAEAYETLFSGTGIKNEDKAIVISPNEFKNGYAIYVIPITPNEPDSATFDVVRTGGMRLEMGFSQALTAAVTVIVYAEFDSVLEIDKDRNVLSFH